MTDEQPPSKVYPKRPKKISLWPLVILALIFVGVYGWNGLMERHWDSWSVRVVTTLVPVPAAVVNGAVITYHQLLKRKDVLVWLNGQKEQTVKSEQLLAVAMDVLIRQEATEQLAEKLRVTVSADDLELARQQLRAEESEQAFQEQIKTDLNMTQAAFLEAVLRPLALAQKVEGVVWHSEELQQAPRARAEEAWQQLASGASFADVAARYSDDPSGVSGGDLGYLTASTLPEGWGALLTTAEGATTPLIETERALVIAKVAWRIGEGEEAQIRTQAIIVKKKTLDQVVDDFLATSVVDRIIDLPE